MMELLGSVAMSPPYQDDTEGEDLFPELTLTMQSLGDSISSMLSEAVGKDPTLGPSPSQVNIVDIDQEEDEEVTSLKESFREQKRKEQPSYPSSVPVSQLLRQRRASSSSHVSSSTPETVVVLPDVDGKEREYRGPNRNAIMAKLNRERKKKQMSELEDMVKRLSSENRELRGDRCRLKSRVTSLEAEVDYLKGVLANQSELSALLKNVKATSLSFHSSISPSPETRQNSAGLERKKRSHSEMTGMTAKRSKLRKVVEVKSPVCLETIQPQSQRNSRRNGGSVVQCKSALYEDALKEKEASVLKGVCLHVRNKKVSLEFCRSCSVKAEAAFEEDVAVE